jgi:hypothetical protein
VKDNPTIRGQDFRCAKGGRKRGERVKRQTGTRMTDAPMKCESFELTTTPGGSKSKSRLTTMSWLDHQHYHIIDSQPEIGKISLRDVYNEIARVRKERLDESWTRNGQYGTMAAMSTSIYRACVGVTRVIFIDATYRTNRYNMRPIHFLAVTPIGRTASIAMCFVTAETETMYRIAVSQSKGLVMGAAKAEVFLTETIPP